MKTKARAPIVKALNLSEDKIQQIKRIMATEVQTKRKDKLREAMDGLPLCSVCSEIPTYSVIYPLDGLSRRESYCDACFDNVYQKTKDVDIHTIAERWNCTIAEPDSMKNVRGYNDTKPKSTGSLSDRTIICSKCRVTRICFDETMRSHNNTLIPLEYHNNRRPHDCDYSYPFRCIHCDTKLFFDRKIRTDKGGLIAIEYDTDVFHECPKKPNRNRNIDDV